MSFIYKRTLDHTQTCTCTRIFIHTQVYYMCIYDDILSLVIYQNHSEGFDWLDVYDAGNDT